MTRDAGFAVGDRSTRTLYDVRLIRATRRMGFGAIVAWDAIVDASWEAGERVTFEDAVEPLPYSLKKPDEIRQALTDVGLLDSEGRIRVDSWAGWFGIATERREAKRERDRKYNARRRNGVGTTSGRGDNGAILPSGPTDPTVPPVPRGRARRGGAPARVGETMKDRVAAHGYKPDDA